MAELPSPRPGRPAGLPVAVARAAGIVVPAAAAMAVGMGAGRFVYTPILSLMTASAGLSPPWGPRSRPPTTPVIWRVRRPASRRPWAVLRLVAGCASALVFMVAANALLTGLRAHSQHLVGHGFGGVGAGIAASGLLVLVLRHGTWQDSWWSAAVLGAVLSAAAGTASRTTSDPFPAGYGPSDDGRR